MVPCPYRASRKYRFASIQVLGRGVSPGVGVWNRCFQALGISLKEGNKGAYQLPQTDGQRQALGTDTCPRGRFYLLRGLLRGYAPESVTGLKPFVSGQALLALMDTKCDIL